MILPVLAAAEQPAAGSGIVAILWMVAFMAFGYFILIRPQQKEQKKKNAMLSELETGDTVLTTSGFYGTVINIAEDGDTIIVEFGNNKNCRIPMKKSAVAEIEKPEEAAV